MSVVACGTPAQLLVVVDTDLEPGVEVAAIDVTVSGPQAFADTHRFDLASTELPFSLGARPAVRDDEAVRVSVTAFGLDGNTVVRFDAETHFVPGQVRVLHAPLARACMMEPPCHDDGMGCVRGECVPVGVDPASLPPPAGDEPRPLFDGPRQAPDAGPPEAGPPCVSDQACDAGDPCRVGRTVCDGDPRCGTVEVLPAGSDCGEGRTCDGEGRCTVRS